MRTAVIAVTICPALVVLAAFAYLFAWAFMALGDLVAGREA